MASYLAELALLDESYNKYKPSVIAASAVVLARYTLGDGQHWYHIDNRNIDIDR